MTRPLQISALAAVLLVTAGRAAEPSVKVAGALQTQDPSATVDVIIRFKTPAGRLGPGVRAVHKRELDLIHSRVYSATVRDLALLATDPDVEYIAPDHPLQATTFSGTPAYGWMTAMDTTAVSGGSSLDGTGIGVAIIDSGVSPNDDLSKRRIVYSESFVPGDATTTDSYRHGMHVAGILAGDGADSTGPQFPYLVRGIAPKVNILNLRVLDQNGVGTDSAVIAAIQRAIQLRSTYTIRVMNLSLGRPVFES